MDKLRQLKYWLIDHKPVMWSVIILCFLLITLPITVYLVQQQIQPPPQAHTLQCSNILIFNQEWSPISLDEIYIGDQVYVTVSGSTTDPQGITKARFSFDDGSTWTETTSKNIHDQFYIQWTVPDLTQVNISAQVYSPDLGWR